MEHQQENPPYGYQIGNQCPARKRFVDLIIIIIIIIIVSLFIYYIYKNGYLDKIIKPDALKSGYINDPVLRKKINVVQEQINKNKANEERLGREAIEQIKKIHYKDLSVYNSTLY
jgi:hypothetical protein